MTDFGTKLASACWEAVQRVSGYSHQNPDLDGVRDLLKDLCAHSDLIAGHALPKAEFDSALDTFCSRTQRNDSASRELRRTCLVRYGFFVEDEDSVRCSQATSAELASPAGASGAEALRLAQESLEGSSAPLRRLLAHVHLLAYPEILPLVRIYALGARAADLDRFAGRLCFARKLNEVVVGYVRQELKELKIVGADPDDPNCALLKRTPPVALAYYLVLAYLQASANRLDVGCDVDRVHGQLELDLGGVALKGLNRGRWQARIRDVDFVRYELDGGQLRVDHESFEWLTAAGIVEPTTVGAVLRACGEVEALGWLHERFEAYWQSGKKSPPKDLDVFLANFKVR